MANEAMQRQVEPYATRGGPDTALAVPVTATDDRRLYPRVTAGEAVACLSVDLAADSAHFEGLVWRHGVVLFELSGTVSTKHVTLGTALIKAVTARLESERGSRAVSSPANEAWDDGSSVRW
jgi:hypothetical protein